jgi:hypothetical protein
MVDVAGTRTPYRYSSVSCPTPVLGNITNITASGAMAFLRNPFGMITPASPFF